MRRIILLAACLLLALGCTARADGYPPRALSGIVQWGAGGGTDSLMRPLCALAETALGARIDVSNMAGGTGSIAAQYVFDRPSDGETLLLGAENPALYDALDISDVTYADFLCVLLLGDETCGAFVRADSPYPSFTALIEDALARPGEVTLATTGVGGLPWEVASLIGRVTGARFNQIPYDSDASARTAVLGGECAFTVCKVQSGLEAHKSGDARFLAMFASGETPELSDVPPVTDEYPDFGEFLPWGPFYGVFVKAGTDAAIVETLSEAFLAAFSEDEYQALLRHARVNPLGLTGEGADAYIDAWRTRTLDALAACGAVSP